MSTQIFTQRSMSRTPAKSAFVRVAADEPLAYACASRLNARTEGACSGPT
jgi:hypothetical protein